MVKHRLRLKPRHHLGKDESHGVEKKWEEIEKRVLGDHGKEEHAKKGKGKDKDKSKKHEGESSPRKSSDSHHSAASNKSKKSKKSEGGVVLGVLAAVEGKDFLTVEAPSKALTSPKNGKQSPGGSGGTGGDDSDDYDDDLEENAFNHPSTYQDQPWIWLPQWESHPEISAQLVEDIKATGVEASDVGALIDDHGIVWVKRNPPDENWDG